MPTACVACVNIYIYIYIHTSRSHFSSNPIARPRGGRGVSHCLRLAWQPTRSPRFQLLGAVMADGGGMSPISTGAARRHRAQHKRAEARHALWLMTSCQTVMSHHTGHAGRGRPPWKAAMEDLRAEVAALHVQLDAMHNMFNE